ncbi:E3 ubiquitin-protein ligase NEURL1B [Spatholobus suberectus]|nr:E3 ubiquitin-protein ligase NEURL1B [Spatholobus suberectus]
MAVAGVHNVTVLESTFLRDSHSQSSGRQGDVGRGGTRSSSVLQMWREIEDEQVVRQVQGRPGEVLLQQRSDGLAVDLSQENMPDSSNQREGHMIEDAVLGENDSETWSQSQNEFHDEQEELNNSSRENSSDFGEVERERVRQIFREWMNSGSRDHASNNSHGNNGSRGEWLGETEQERVSIIREWVQMSSQQRGFPSGENREEQSSEIGAQIDCVRDRFVVNQSEGQTEHIRRGIRKLCGRQVLLDMLKKAEMERQREVQELLDHRVVSHFPHRNRIQALLRGRFLRNDRSIDNNRSTSIAESELGLLRQKQTVSGLREGFFFRKDNFGCSQATSNPSDTSSESDSDVNTIEQTGASCSQAVPTVHSEQSEPNNKGSDIPQIPGDQICSQGTTCENLDWQGSTAHVETRDWESSPSIRVERGDGTRQNVDMMPTGDPSNDLTQQNLQIEDTEHGNMQELSEVHTEQSQWGDITNDESNLSNHDDRVYSNIVGDVDLIESIALEGEQQEEVIIENDGSDWHPSVDDNQLSSTTNEWPQNVLGSEDGENSRMQEQEAPEVWQEDGGFQEAVEIWLGGPSDNEVAPVGRIHGFYFPEDDNVYSVELRELLSRRSVSNLLRSSFRESLDQLIQSYVERQGHAHVEWELQETTPSSPLAEQDSGQQSRGPIVGPQGTVNSSLDRPLPPTPPPLPLWDRHSRHDNWSQSDINNQRLGIEWDIVNDLRIDMVRLQQRMNNMQRMLEACMDMQLELQRSIRQEVSAALNRSAGSSGIYDRVSPDDKSKWECVRNGLCCICCESNIDSLLYRCGHMCTCSKCANDLLQSKRKCPMCQAPVVEVIRAYSIL